MTKHFRTTDLRGLARLATQATSAVTRVTEGVHQSVLGTLGFAASEPQRTDGLTGLVYRSVLGITQGVGWGIETAMQKLEPLLGAEGDAGQAESPQRVAILSALNGVLGDRLQADGSPFAITMSLFHQGSRLDPLQPITMPAATGHILLMVHGLCMNELQWRSTSDGQPAHHHGEIIGAALGKTVVELRYNSGRHISHNGRELAGLLEQLIANWPLPVESMDVIAHSMGGLVIRSAIHAARQQQLSWVNGVRHVVFLGTPHHGAPLERAGHGVDLLLAASRWTAPFGRLAGLRSAGITDLRHGRLLDDDWQNRSGRRSAGDDRSHLPLPAGIGWHAIAATTAARRSALADRLVGDGLVPLDSALGRHRLRERRLQFAAGSTWISHRTGHLALLHRPEITDRMLAWLGAG